MAFTKIGDWTSPVANEADRPNRTAADMKAVFDSNSNEIRTAFNRLCDDAQAEIDTLRRAAENGELDLNFTVADERACIASGDSLAVILGKLRRLGIDAELAISTVRRDGTHPDRYLSLDGTYTTPPAGAAANGVKQGGASGQMYVKQSGADYDADWETVGPETVGAAPAPVKDAAVSLPAAAWSGGTDCTLAVSGMGITADSVVFIAPTEASLPEWNGKAVRCTGSGTDALSFTCDTAPGDLSFQLVVWNA